jgi:hypothetical protein
MIRCHKPNDRKTPMTDYEQRLDNLVSRFKGTPAPLKFPLSDLAAKADNFIPKA